MTYTSCFRILVVFCATVALVSSHGRFIEPPSRASAWRYGFSTPRDYNDNEGFCGGKQRQHATNGGRCGLCGDTWDEVPRPHEVGGRYATGTIVRRYKPGAQIHAGVEITANHKGYFEFRICPTNSSSVEATQACLDRYPLSAVGSAQHRLYIGDKNGVYNFQLQLPSSLACRHCVMQWRYVAGNDWGICPDGSGALGCGPQEEFRACADVSILPSNAESPYLDDVTSPSQAARPAATNPPPFITDLIFGVPVTRVSSRRTCSARGPWRNVLIMDSWCDSNCNHEPSYCPSSHCVCV